MADVTIKQKQVGNYHIEIRLTDRYNMTFYEVISTWYGKQDLNNVYSLDEIKQATRCFYRYCARAKRLGD